MNFNMHPDLFYEVNRLERLDADGRRRPFNIQQVQQANGRSLKDRALLTSGNLFVSVGKNLQERATHQVCEPQTI